MTYVSRAAKLADARLRREDFLTAPEVAVALDTDPRTVKAWWETGEIEGYDAGAGSTEFLKLVRSSVIEFVERRAAGIRAPAPRTTPDQPELFKQGDRT